MTKSQKLKYCVGCRDNVYNLGLNGVTECWMLKNAKLVWKKAVPIDQRPPWTQPARRVLDCYREKGYIYVHKDTIC